MVYLFSKQYIIVLRHIIIKQHLSTVQYRILYGAIHYNNFYTSIEGVVGWCEGAVYLTSPGCPADIGLQLGKACYPCSG